MYNANSANKATKKYYQHQHQIRLKKQKKKQTTTFTYIYNSKSETILSYLCTEYLLTCSETSHKKS